MCLKLHHEISVPSKEVFHWAKTCFGVHVIAQSYGHTNSEAVQGLYDTYPA